ncbi:MAG: BON domain-containing protein [Burkholderiaceae bacterium]
MIGGIAAGTAVVATDRRSTGTQLDDKTMEVRIAKELTNALRGNDIHINVNSFEHRVLLSGEVSSEEIRAQAGAVASRSKDVRLVNNELVVAPPSTFRDRTDDNTLGARVRASFVSTREIAFNSVDIITERRIVYLMGLVTQKESEVAALVASRVPGVQQVVKLFDIGSAAEVNRRRVAVSPASAQAPAAASAPIITVPVTSTPGVSR